MAFGDPANSRVVEQRIGVPGPRVPAAHVGDVVLKFPDEDKSNPLLSFSADWSDLDLSAIGSWSGFGDMRGSLEGNFNNARLALTPSGPLALNYEFRIEGKQRSGKDIRFYGRAVDNIMGILGSRKADMPWYARLPLNIAITFRNWMPVRAYYMGFKAKADENWTELSTFDPPIPENPRLIDDLLPCGTADRFILCGGEGFKIPLNTHGVYPLLMTTSAFQSWLREMVDYFQNRVAHDPNEASTPATQCHAIWEES